MRVPVFFFSLCLESEVRDLRFEVWVLTFVFEFEFCVKIDDVTNRVFRVSLMCVGACMSG